MLLAVWGCFRRTINTLAAYNIGKSRAFCCCEIFRNFCLNFYFLWLFSLFSSEYCQIFFPPTPIWASVALFFFLQIHTFHSVYLLWIWWRQDSRAYLLHEHVIFCVSHWWCSHIYKAAFAPTLLNFFLWLGSSVSAVTCVECVIVIKYDIFVNCDWVDTRWQ